MRQAKTFASPGRLKLFPAGPVHTASTSLKIWPAIRCSDLFEHVRHLRSRPLSILRQGRWRAAFSSLVRMRGAFSSKFHSLSFLMGKARCPLMVRLAGHRLSVKVCPAPRVPAFGPVNLDSQARRARPRSTIGQSSPSMRRTKMKNLNQTPHTISSHDLNAALLRTIDFKLKVQLAELYPQEAPTLEELEQQCIDWEIIKEAEEFLF